MTKGAARSPMDLLGVLGTAEAPLDAGLRQLEVYTREGLLMLLWHGPPDAENVVVTLGGAIGGTLGPADSLYLRLGRAFAEAGVGTVRLHYRRPGRLEPCLLDAAAAADLAARAGAKRFVFVGHSFGGAVAVQAGGALGAMAAGVVGLATQSAGCEQAEQLTEAGTPLLLLHGAEDQILTPQNSEMVRMLAGGGELEVIEGADHGLASAASRISGKLGEWIPARFAEHAGRR